MNKKVLRNKASLMKASERKKMYKSGKNWLVAGTLFLALLGGTKAAAKASTNPQPAKPQTPNSPAAITNGANNLHAQLTVNAGTQLGMGNPLDQGQNNDNQDDNTDTDEGRTNPNNKPIDNNQNSNSQNDSNNMPNNGRKQNGYNAPKIGDDSSNGASKDNQSSDNADQAEPNLLGGMSEPDNVRDAPKVTTGTYDGMTYTDDGRGDVTFTGGTAQSDLSNFISKSPFSKAVSVKFGNSVDTSNVNNISGMFSSDSDLKNIDFGRFNFSKTQNNGTTIISGNLDTLNLSNASGLPTTYNGTFSFDVTVDRDLNLGKYSEKDANDLGINVGRNTLIDATAEGVHFRNDGQGHLTFTGGIETNVCIGCYFC